MTPSGEDVLAAAERLLATAAATDWHGPDAYDGLWWRWPRPLVGGRRRRQALVQLHARAPVDVRRLYRRSHPRIAKALALFATADLRRHAQTGDARSRERALRALRALDADRSAGPVAWGYPFDVQTRWSFYPAGSANVVVTSYAGQALLEAEAAGAGRAFGERARAAAEWVRNELWVPAGHFAYHAGSTTSVHNASLLGAALVHAAGVDDGGRVARAVERTLAAQAADGSFPYGEGPGLGWVDSFHTGFVLSCLAALREVDAAVDDALRRGAAFYARFFDERGRALLWHDRPFPEDAHSAGTGMTTLAVLHGLGLADPDLLARVTARTLEAGLRDGHAVPRRHRWGRVRAHYTRWCDAHVARGLVDAAGVLAARPAPAASAR